MAKIKMTIIKHDEIKSASYRKNQDWFEDHNNGGYPCIICGKEIKDENWHEGLHVFDGGALLTDFGEFPEDLRKRDVRFSEAGDMLCYPVGPVCWRKWLKVKKSGKYEEEIEF